MKRPHHLFARQLQAAVLAHQLGIPFQKALDGVPVEVGKPWYALADALDTGDMIRLAELVPVERTAEEMADALSEELFRTADHLGKWIPRAVRDRVLTAMKECAARAVLEHERSAK